MEKQEKGVTYFDDIYLNCCLNEETKYFSDETVDTSTVESDSYSLKHKRKITANNFFISDNIKIKNRANYLQEELTILDNFKVIFYGCIGIRTYKMFY